MPDPDVQLRTESDLDELLATAEREPVLVFKHSTACPVSSHAHGEFQAWLDQGDADRPKTALVRVIEERSVSLALADRIGVTHQSPQAILLRDGQAVWHRSHDQITVDALRDAVRA